VFVSLTEAVERHVRPGDTVNLIMGHSRWTALGREVARQHWHRDSGLTLVMASLSSLGALFFRAGCLAKVVTAYSGDSFPTYTPNPVYQRAYASGEVEVEHWSFLTFQQRLRAAAQGLPAVVTGSLAGSSMADNAAFAQVASPFGEVGLLAPLVPDVALVHAAVADTQGNLAMAAPLLEGVDGAFAARRGVVATVERIVDDLRPWSDQVRIPAHRVLAVVEAPFGAHPGGLYAGTPGSAGALPVTAYGEDIPFWIEARDATRLDPSGLDDWIRTWCLDLTSHDDYLERLGRGRLDGLVRRADPDSWHDDDAAMPVDLDRPVTSAERAAAWAADALADRIEVVGADAVLAGAGLANLAAWVGVARARERGAAVVLTAELGMWDYTPTPADPFIFNFRAFPGTAMLSDAAAVLGTLLGGPGTRSIACVGAAQADRHGNLNSTTIPHGPFLVGSGGANDVVSRADETVVVTSMDPRRLVDRVGYVTCPGDRVMTVVTDLGILRRDPAGADLVLTEVVGGETPQRDRVRDVVARCGWDLDVARDVTDLSPPDAAAIAALRNHDRQGWFLGT